MTIIKSARNTKAQASVIPFFIGAMLSVVIALSVAWPVMDSAIYGDERSATGTLSFTGKVNDSDLVNISTETYEFDTDSSVSGLYTTVDIVSPLNGTGLVGEWLFEGAGNKTNDTSGLNNNGTWYGNITSNWTTSTIGFSTTALSFDGVDDYIGINKIILSNITLSFGVMSDIHHSNYVYTSSAGIGDNSQNIKNYINYTNNNVSFSIFTGDSVHDATEDPTWRYLTSSEMQNNLDTFYSNATLYNLTSNPLYFVLGNHDVIPTNKSAVSTFGMPSNYYSFVINNTKVIVLDAQYNLDGTNKSSVDADYSEGFIPPTEMDWLNSTLDDANTNSQKCLIFIHQNPLITGVYGISNSALLTSIIETRYPSLVKGVFFAHSHVNSYSLQNNIKYISSYSPVWNVSDTTRNDYSYIKMDDAGNFYRYGSGGVTTYQASSFTTHYWMKPNTGYGNVAGRLLDFDEINYVYQYILSNTGIYTSYILFNNSAIELESTSTIPINQWTFTSTTYDGTVGRLYINGILVDAINNTGVLGIPTYPLNIGNRGSNLNRGFDGYIDEVRIYNRALSATEITNLYQRGAKNHNASYSGSQFVTTLNANSAIVSASALTASNVTTITSDVSGTPSNSLPTTDNAGGISFGGSTLSGGHNSAQMNMSTPVATLVDQLPLFLVLVLIMVFVKALV